jgi:hypothetical protein
MIEQWPGFYRLKGLAVGAGPRSLGLVVLRLWFNQVEVGFARLMQVAT